MTDPLRLVCHCGTIRQTARALTALYDAALAPHGIKVTQFTILAVIKELDAPATGDLAQALIMDSTSLSRALATLKKKGLINVRRGGDLRMRYWYLTDRGRAKLKACREDWEKAQARVTRLHGAKNQKDLNSRIYLLGRKVAKVLQSGQ